MSFWNWVFKPARWWEFWLPSSGLRGGFIGGVLLGLLWIWVLSLL